jgi:NADH-quinone oxidoreductase subunit J
VSVEQVAFWVLAPISVGSAIAMLLQRNAVHAALLLVVNLVTVAIFYLMLDAPFLFAVQIIVYAGAIVVLFLFVIMLLGVDREEPLTEPIRWQRPAAVVLGLGVFLELVVAIRAGVGFATRGPEAFAGTGGSTEALARDLFRSYFLPFEATSILLIIAAVAVMLLARRREPPSAEAARAEPAEEPEEVGV